MIEFTQIQTFVVVLLTICGAITVIASAVRAVAPLLHPFKKVLDRLTNDEKQLGEHDAHLTKHDRYLDNDKKEIETLKEIQKANVKANLAMLHNHLYESCTHYLAVGIMTIDEMDNLDCIYEAYHALGGNGTGTRLYERCKTLKLKEVADERLELQSTASEVRE